MGVYTFDVPGNWERHLERWTAASLIDSEIAARIRSWESERASGAGLRWPTLLALAFGAILLAAGVLLFVSAHWDALAPAQRFGLVIGLVAVFHIAGASTAQRFEAMSIALQTVGTIALGAGISLTGQIFNLDVHWPSGIMLWSAGAVIGWIILRHWTQAALAAILIPFWLQGEWMVAMQELGLWYWAPAATGLFLTAVTYLTSRRSSEDSALRHALGWIGGIAFIPLAATLCYGTEKEPGWQYQLTGWSIALAGPLALAFVLRGRTAVWNVAAAGWALVLYRINQGGGDHLVNYVWSAVGCGVLIFWGIRERRAERINLGIAAFAITAGAFYFSSVMDKLGRSASLIGLGVLFLAGGWILERARRKLVARVKQEPA